MILEIPMQLSQHLPNHSGAPLVHQVARRFLCVMLHRAVGLRPLIWTYLFVITHSQICPRQYFCKFSIGSYLYSLIKRYENLFLLNLWLCPLFASSELVCFTWCTIAPGRITWISMISSWCASAPGSGRWELGYRVISYTFPMVILFHEWSLFGGTILYLLFDCKTPRASWISSPTTLSHHASQW